jgi:hypothetical protein
MLTRKAGIVLIEFLKLRYSLQRNSMNNNWLYIALLATCPVLTLPLPATKATAGPRARHSSPPAPPTQICLMNHFSNFGR